MNLSICNCVHLVCPNHFTPILTEKEAKNPRTVDGLRRAISSWRKSPASLLDQFTNMNRDYRGRFYDPKLGFHDPYTGFFHEAFVDMEPLEEAPYEWWRDIFFYPCDFPVVMRVRSEAAPRWRAIGSIYRAWFPEEFAGLQGEAANDNGPPSGS